MLFNARLVGDGVDVRNFTGVWYGGRGGTALLARTGDKVPGGTANTRGVNAEGLNAAGTICLSASYETGAAYYFGTPDALRPVFVPGRPLPGLAADQGEGLATEPVFNNKGQIAVVVRAAPGANAVRDGHGGSVVVGTPGTWARIATTGEPAAGCPAGETYGRLNGVSGLGVPVLGDSGHVAFAGSVRTPRDGPGELPTAALWVGKPGAVALVARSGASAPGFGNDEPFFFFDERSICVDDAGGVSFSAEVGRPRRSRVASWIFRDGRLSLLLGPDAPMQVDGLAGGQTCTLAGAPTAVRGRGGQAVAVGRLAGPGIGADNNAALLLFTPGRGWALVARAGDVVDGPDGPAGPLRSVSWVGPPSRDGRFLFIGTVGPVGPAACIGQPCRYRLGSRKTQARRAAPVGHVVRTTPHCSRPLRHDRR